VRIEGGEESGSKYSQLAANDNQHEKEEVDVRAEGWLSECGSYDRSCSFPLPIGTKTR